MRTVSVAITPTQTYPAYARGESRSANQVTVLFEDMTRRFSIPAVATFGYLADALSEDAAPGVSGCSR